MIAALSSQSGENTSQHSALLNPDGHLVNYSSRLISGDALLNSIDNFGYRVRWSVTRRTLVKALVH